MNDNKNDLGNRFNEAAGKLGV